VLNKFSYSILIYLEKYNKTNRSGTPLIADKEDKYNRTNAELLDHTPWYKRPENQLVELFLDHGIEE
jgi:hypothetical protein